MCKPRFVQVTGDQEFVFIDKDTGTILGSNVVAVRVTDLEYAEQIAAGGLSDSDVCDLGEELGCPVYRNSVDD